MTQAALLLGLVVEGPSDARTAPEIVDRVLVLQVPMKTEALDLVRDYRGLNLGKAFLAWKGVHAEAGKRRIPRRHGHFDGAPGIEDARTAVTALRCFVAETPRPAAVLLVRDSDGKQGERAQGLEQARRDSPWPFEVIIGVADTMREWWILDTFKPRNAKEQACLSIARAEARQDVKRAVATLTDDDREREADCFREADIDHLRRAGAGNGLASFVGELDQKLAPLVRRLPRTAWEALDGDDLR